MNLARIENREPRETIDLFYNIFVIINFRIILFSNFLKGTNIKLING